MSKKQDPGPNWLRINALRLSRVHFFYTFVFAVSIVIYDAWRVITPAVVLQRWTVAACLLCITTFSWYLSRSGTRPVLVYQCCIYGLIFIDIFLATYLVYSERGMASRGVALFAIPIAVSAVLMKRSALLATTALCLAAYSLAAVRYFVVYFNEGFKIELYGTLIFYGMMFFILAATLLVAIRYARREM